tara:strand:+ start:360 stop:530 length:171 start_codon:yes stop_codon:yes gene_type:complete
MRHVIRKWVRSDFRFYRTTPGGQVSWSADKDLADRFDDARQARLTAGLVGGQVVPE